MAEVRFFKGVYPRQKLFLSNGAYIQLHDVGNNEGVFASDNEQVIRDLTTMIQKRRGGLVEINGEEYTGLKKKGMKSPDYSREEWSLSGGVRINHRPVLPGGPADMRGNFTPEEPRANAAATNSSGPSPSDPVPPVEVPKPAVRKRGRPPKVRPPDAT